MAGRGKPIPLVTRAQLAKVLNVSLRKVTELEQAEVLVPKRRGRGGRPSLYDLALAVPTYIAYVSDGTTGGNPALKALIRLKTAQAVRTEQAIAKEEGSMVSRDEVSQQGQAYTKALSAVVRGWPRRLTQAGVITREQEPAAAAVSRELLLDIANWKGLGDTDKVSKNGSLEP